MIGLDIDRDYVRLVELKESSEGITLTKYGVARVTLQSAAEGISQAISRTIAELFAREGIEEKEVYTSISGPRVQVRRIALPSMPKEELNEAVKWEAKNFVPFSIETAKVDYYLLKTAEGKSTKQELIVVAVDGEALKRHLNQIQDAGLKCLGITPACFGLWELAKFHPEFESPELKALLHLGEGGTCLNLFKDHDFLFSRELDFSAEFITRSLANTLKLEPEQVEKILGTYGLPKEEEEEFSQEKIKSKELRQNMFSIFGKLQNEILSSLEYYREQFEEEKVSQIFLVGETARLKNLKEYLVANFGIPIEVVDPLRNLKLDPGIDPKKIKEVAQHLALPIGLALGKSREINLLKSKAKKKEVGLETLKFLDYVQIPNTAIVGTLALFLALIFSLNFYLSFSIGKIRKDLDTKSIKLSQVMKLRDRRKAFEDITKNEIDVKLLLARVNSLMPQGLSLSYLTFDNKNREVSLGGESNDPKMASAFVKGVEESPYFRRAELIEIKKTGRATTFKMKFMVK